MRDHGPLPRLYLITDRHAVAGGRLVEAVSRALEGGVRLVQLRDKDLPARELAELAARLRQLTREHGALLLLNAGDQPSRLELARGIEADGVDLTSAGGVGVDDVRRQLGEEALVGVSTHSRDELDRAARAGASFATFGPVFATPSKRGMGEPTGVTALAEAVRDTPGLPIFALGGIGAANLDAVRSSGAYGVAMIRGVLAAGDPAAGGGGRPPPPPAPGGGGSETH